MKKVFLVLSILVFAFQFTAQAFWNPFDLRVPYYSDQPSPPDISPDEYETNKLQSFSINDGKITLIISPPVEGHSKIIQFTLVPKAFVQAGLDYKINKFEITHDGKAIPLKWQPTIDYPIGFRCFFDKKYSFEKLTLRLDFVLIQNGEEFHFNKSISIYRGYIVYPFITRLLD